MSVNPLQSPEMRMSANQMQPPGLTSQGTAPMSELVANIRASIIEESPTQGGFSFYSRPKQMAEWDKPMPHPHTNWFDLFFPAPPKGAWVLVGLNAHYRKDPLPH
jgi:hypothetical protein